MQTYRFTIDVACNATETYKDNGFIILPDTYTDCGAPTRLVINCHGAGGTVTTDDSQVEHQALTQYLVANGYAVMDVNGLPADYAEKYGIDLRNNVGCPIAMQSYVKAYHYCIEKFNLYSEVFVHGGSMGGISSTNLVLSGKIPVIAHSAFCPVLDTYNEIFLHPWSGGLPKTALAKFYGFDMDAQGEYIYDEEKVLGLNPANNPKAVEYPVPVKFWQCEDDPVVSIEVTKAFVARIKENGFLVTFPSGGHEPQDYGPPVEQPAGNTLFNGAELKINPAVEGVYTWIKRFDRVP